MGEDSGYRVVTGMTASTLGVVYIKSCLWLHAMAAHVMVPPAGSGKCHAAMVAQVLLLLDVSVDEFGHLSIRLDVQLFDLLVPN